MMLWQPTRGILQPNQHWRRAQAGGPVFIVGPFTATSAGGDWSLYTLRQALPISVLTVPGFAPTQIRVTVMGGVFSDSWTFSKFYIGHQAASGDNYDYASAPTQLLWGGNASGTVLANSFLTSDWASFAWNRTSGLVYTAYTDNVPTADEMGRYVLTGASTYYKSGDDAATVDATGYSVDGNNRINSVASIEVQ